MAFEGIRSQLQKVKQAITGQRKEYEQIQQQTQAYDPRVMQTRSQLQRATPYSQAQIQRQEFERQQAKQQALGQIQTQQQAFEQQARAVEQQAMQQEAQIQAYEQQQADWDFAQKVAGKKDFPVSQLPKDVQRKVYDIRQSQRGLEQFRQQQQSMESLGLKPVYVGGKLTGFEDVSKGMSYRVEDLPEFRPMDLPELEKAGIITTKLPTSPDASISELIEAVDIGARLGKEGKFSIPLKLSEVEKAQFYGYDTGYYEGRLPVMQPTKFQQAISRIQEPMKAKEYEYYQKKLAEWESLPEAEKQRRREIELPFGLSTAMQPEYLSGRKFSPWTSAAFLSRGLTKSIQPYTSKEQTFIDPYEFQTKTLMTDKPLDEYGIKTITYEPPKFSGEWWFNLLGAIQLTGFFEPAIATGVAGKGIKTKQVTKTQVTSGVKFSKGDFEDFVRELYIKGDKEKLRQALRKVYDSGSDKAVKEFEAMLKNSIGKKGALDLIKDVRAQQGFTQPQILRGEIDLPQDNIWKSYPTYVGGEGKGVSAYQGGQAEEYETYITPIEQARTFTRSEEMFKPSDILVSRPLVAPITTISTAQIFKTLEQQKQNLFMKTAQEMKQQSQYKQATLVSSALASRTLQAQRYKTQQRYKTKQILKQRYRPRTRPRIPRPPKIPFWLPGGESKNKKFKDLFRTKSPTSFNVWTKTKGKEKIIALGVTKKAGLDIGAGRTLKTLRASFWLTPSKQPAKNIKTFGEFARFRNVFRPSKTKAGAFVQKARLRLSAPAERKEIQLERRKKKIKEIW